MQFCAIIRNNVSECFWDTGEIIARTDYAENEN